MMPKKQAQSIPSFKLSHRYFYIHKLKMIDTGFGMDNTTEIMDKGFAVYSCQGSRDKIGPMRSNFYRIAFCFGGSIEVQIGLEKFKHEPNTIHFNAPDQLFAFRNKSADVQMYYAQFTADFIEEILSTGKIKKLYPFFDYSNVPFFKLGDMEAKKIKGLLEKISDEIKHGGAENSRAVKLLLNLIMIEAKRTYLKSGLHHLKNEKNDPQLLKNFKRELSHQFLTIRAVKDYAARLAVSPNHLNKIVKRETGKSPGQLIDEMLIMEIKALLKYTDLSISEVAYQLDFTDTSHFSKFFKRHAGFAPLDYRKRNR